MTRDNDVEVADSTLMRPADVARYIGIPEQTLYQWRYRRVGPRCMKVGRHLRYRRADVDRWLEDQAR
jgi:excisionase family DNA binding protein